ARRPGRAHRPDRGHHPDRPGHAGDQRRGRGGRSERAFRVSRHNFVSRRSRWYKGPSVMRPKPVHLALTAVLLGAFLPIHAQAQTCAMLPPGTPAAGQQAPAEAQQAAIDAVTRALTADQITVIGTPDAQRRMVGEPFAECNALDCGAQVARSLGVDFVVLVTLWAPRGEPTSV